MSKDVLKLALDDLMAEYCMERTSFARRVDEIFEQALAAPVQEPAVRTATRLWNRRGLWNCPADIERDLLESYTTPPTPPAAPVQPAPVQEPVAWIWKYANGEEEVVFVPPRHVDASHVDAPSIITPLYTTPPAAQRPWVGLTDERVRQLCGSVPSMKAAVREAEAELKEKNT